uniref:Uncharacterized protein n=1 Tax=Anopheles culicifacies TaxID=139723 RepID=A0A2C9GUN0_9DIPT
MGLNVQHSVVLYCFIASTSLFAVRDTVSTSCTIELPQYMITRLMKTEQTGAGCEEAWTGLQAQLQQTHQNLTECHQREESPKVLDTPQTSCQQPLEQLRKQAEDALRMLNAYHKRQLQYEQGELVKSKKEHTTLQKQLKSVQDELKGMYQHLLLLYIDLGDVRRALYYYHILVSLKEPNLFGTIVKFVYSSKKHENRRLENLLALVKHLPTASEKKELYGIIQPEIMKRETQHFSFLALIVSLDMGKFVNEKQQSNFKTLRDAMFQHVIKRWKFQMLGGNYRDIVDFAKKYPDYFQKIGVRIATVRPQYWFKFSYSQFVTYPNLLPLPKQRLEALQTIIRQVKQRNKTYFSYYLAHLAKQVDICEKYIQQHYRELDIKEELVKLKLQFSDFDKAKGYEYYLKNVKDLTKTKPPLPANPNRPKTRGVLSGRR